MPMAHVRPFLKQVLTDRAFRDKLTAAASEADRTAILADYGYEFSDAEFEEGYNSTLVGLQFEEDANRLKEFKLMWDMLRRL